jgi:hypothetical protein
MRHILAFLIRRKDSRKAMPDKPQPIIFDFRERRVYESGDRSMMRDLGRALREIRAIQKRIVLTVGGTPPPDTQK